MTGADRELARRGFLERMTALAAGAVLAPPSLRALSGGPAPSGARVRPWSPPPPGPVQATELVDLTLVESAHLIRRGEVSPLELVRAYLDRIERWDGTYRAFNHVAAERAVEEARRLEAAPDPLPLRGIPLAVKDNFLTAGIPTTANSLIFRDFVPAFDATAWAKLSAAGAVLIGKTQMGPLATTAATTPEGEATTVNAWAPLDRRGVSPGGSSSGSATAVAGRLAASATGTQTGGSITGPSAAQGLTGIKPTLGRVSLHGIIPLTYTRDHVGPLARDARDAAVMLQAMAGPDSEDPRSLGLPPVPDYVAAVAPTGTPDRPRLAEGARIGVLPGYLSESSDSGAQQEQEPPFAPQGAWERAGRPRERRAARIEARRRMLEELEGLGARPVEIDLPPAWEELTSRELNNVRLPERSEIFLEELRRDVRNFGVSLSPWINGLLLPGAEYVRGQRARLLLLRSILDDIFSRCDAVVQTEPFPFDMVGLPLISFPIGFEEPESAVRRPIGALLGGPPYEEGLLLSLAAAYQGVTDWHRRRPPDPDAFRAREAEGSSGRGRGTTPRYDLFDVMERGE